MTIDNPFATFKRHAEPLDHENKHPNLHENTECESVKSVVTSAVRHNEELAN